MKNIFVIMLFVFSALSLNASQKVNIDVKCTNLKEFVMKIDSNTLELSVDAVQDNIGGYVDIPEDWYYLKSDSNIFELKGMVENENEKVINRFKSFIKSDDLKELYSVRESDNLKFIQKINLENDNKDKLVKNILDVSFNIKLFENEYKKCTH